MVKVALAIEHLGLTSCVSAAVDSIKQIRPTYESVCRTKSNPRKLNVLENSLKVKCSDIFITL